MAKDSLPELELANVRTRERLTDSVAEIRRRSDVPARTRLAVAKARQRWRRDPTPLVAMGITAVTGIAAIVLGARIGRTDAGHLDRPPAFTALLPFGARGEPDPDQAKGGRKARKARRKAAEESLERDPVHRNRVKQRAGISAVQRRATANRKQAAKRSKAAAKALAKARG